MKKHEMVYIVVKDSPYVRIWRFCNWGLPEFDFKQESYREEGELWFRVPVRGVRKELRDELVRFNIPFRTVCV